MNGAKRPAAIISTRSYHSFYNRVIKTSLWKKFLPFAPVIGVTGGWLFWQHRIVKNRKNEVIKSADLARKANISQSEATKNYNTLKNKWSAK